MCKDTSSFKLFTSFNRNELEKHNMSKTEKSQRDVYEMIEREQKDKFVKNQKKS